MYTTKYLLIFLLALPATAEDTTSNNSSTDDELRNPRSSGRIVKLYSGKKPEPFLCSGEGFHADSNDCAIFYRCIKSAKGKYSVFRFQCGPGTVYDPETEVCNHPRNTKRAECGGLKESSLDTSYNDGNEIEGIQQELPTPISTKLPVYTERTTPATSYLIEQSSSKKPSYANVDPYRTSTKRQEFHDNTSPTTATTKYQDNSGVSTSTSPPELSFSVNKQTNPSDTICTSDGFIGDSENCHKFYRCVRNQKDGYTKYEFSCSELTIWDDDIQACNHPWAVKRSRCGRSSVANKDFSIPNTIDIARETTTQANIATHDLNDNTIQQQLQISYGSKVTQNQIQISKGPAIQNQTQINYGDKVNKTEYSSVHQNQTQISYGSAVSQVQTQINHENEVVQTQLQIDHMKESSQSQVQIQESTTKNTATNTDDNVCSESGFMGDSNDCKKFYRCVNNGRGSFTRYEFSCGEGTVWDSKTEACNHAWLVKECGRNVPSSIATQETSSTSTMKWTQSNDITTTKTSHNYYPTSEVTPTKDFEDAGYGSQNQDTPTPAIITTTTTIPDNTNPEENECKSSGFMGDTKDCKIFYRCVENGKGGYTKHEFKCGEGTVWDPDIEGCNHAWAVKNCGGSSSVNNTTDSTTTTTSAITTNSNSQPTEQIIQNDDIDTGYNSQEDTFVSTTIKTTKQPQVTDDNESNECQTSGFMGDKHDCNKFYRCVDNDNGSYTRYEFTCGEGTVWDPKIQACNHAWAVEHCGNSYPASTGDEISYHNVTTAHEQIDVSVSTQSEVNADTTTINSLTSTTTVHSIVSTDGSKCSSDGFIGDDNDCKKFYRCVDNGDGSYTRHEFVCGEATVWDQHIEACNHAWAVEKCGNINETVEHVTTSQTSPIIMNDEEIANGYPMQENDIVSQTTQSALVSSTAETSSDSLKEQHNCSSSGFFGDSMNCKKFYRCVDDGKGGFVQYEFKCGEGTVWDQSIEACNHAWEVKTCGSESNTTSSQTETTTLSSSTTLTEKTTISSQTYPSNENTADCEQPGFFGVKSDCKKFYRCVENGEGGFVKYEFSCGDGTYWNQNIIACDHASPNQSCSENESTIKEPENQSDEMFTGTTTKTTTTLVSVASEETSTIETSQHNICKSEGFYSDSNDCTKFYRCVDNGIGSYTKYDFTCGDGTVWNQEILACDHISSNNQCTPLYSSTEISGSQQSNNENYTTTVTTITQVQQSTEKTDTVTSSSNNQCKAEGFYGDSSDCKKFIRCVSNHNGGYTVYEFTCGEGTIWVQDIQACDHDNGDESCSIPKNNSTTQAETTESQQPPATSETIFTTSSSHPQTPDRENDEIDNENAKEPDVSRQNCTSEGFYANDNDCKKFYRCVDNNNGGYTRYDFTCGEGTAWDGDIQACNHITQVKTCDNSVVQDSQMQPIMHDDEVSQTTENSSTTKTTTPSESDDNASSTQDACKREGYYGNTKNCKLFYRCVDDGKGGLTKYEYSCGDGTIWDQDITACNHPQDVVNPSCKQEQAETSTSASSSASPTTSSTSSSEISESATQSTTQSSGQASQNCTQNESSSKPENKNITCNKAGFYPDPNNCKKFYRCVDWDNDGKRFSVYHFECGEGTIWDPAVETCNHEESVYPPRDCSGAQSQNENMGSTTTEESTTIQTTTNAETTTSQLPVTEQITDEHSTSTETATTQQSSTSEQTTTPQSSTSTHTTTEQSTSTEKSTTQQPSTSEQTTAQQTTTSDQTTQQSSTSSQSTSTEKSTTQQSSTSEQTTTQQSSTSTQSTSPENSTTQQSSTIEQTTTEESTTTDQTTQQSSTSEQTTTEQSTASEPTSSTQTSTSVQTSTTTEQTSVKPSTSTDQTTQATDSGGGTTDGPMTTDSSATTEGTSTESQTTSHQTTTDHAATDNSSNNETTTTETPTATTTQSSETSTTTENQHETTTNGTSTSDCPDTDSDQNVFVCPTSFRRHPKYCNVFYQCTEEDDSHDAKIAVFTCPNNTIYDESKTQCVEEDKADKPCKGEIAARRRFKRVGFNIKEPIIVTRDKQVCSSVGHVPFEKNSECSPAFLKCERTKSGKLRGFVYQCPKGYIYWSISKRCEQIHNVINCKRTTNNWNNRWEIPIERSNVAW